jgi:hypothetical protein
MIESQPSSTLSVGQRYEQLHSRYQSAHGPLTEDYATMLSLRSEIDRRLRDLQEKTIEPLKKEELQTEKRRYGTLFIGLERSFENARSLRSQLNKGVKHLQRVNRNALNKGALDTLLEYDQGVHEKIQRIQQACSSQLKTLKTYLEAIGDLQNKMATAMTPLQKSVNQFFLLDKQGQPFREFLSTLTLPPPSRNPHRFGPTTSTSPLTQSHHLAYPSSSSSMVSSSSSPFYPSLAPTAPPLQGTTSSYASFSTSALPLTYTSPYSTNSFASSFPFAPPTQHMSPFSTLSVPLGTSSLNPTPLSSRASSTNSTMRGKSPNRIKEGEASSEEEPGRAKEIELPKISLRENQNDRKTKSVNQSPSSESSSDGDEGEDGEESVDSSAQDIYSENLDQRPIPHVPEPHQGDHLAAYQQLAQQGEQQQHRQRCCRCC